MSTALQILGRLGGWSLAVTSLACASSQPQSKESEALMSDEPMEVLKSSDDPRQLTSAAIVLARGTQPQGHQVVLRSLQSEVFLGRLNTPEEYLDGAPDRLRVRRILEELAKNKTAGPQQVLLELTKNPTFAKEPARVELLIRYSAGIRPAPAGLVKFWERHSGTEDGLAWAAVAAAIENGTKPAIEFFEQRLIDPQYDEEEKLDWLRTSVLIHRHQAGLLESCDRLLAGGLSPPLKSELVDVLFDYKPTRWHKPSGRAYPPPPLSAYGPTARIAIRRLAERILKDDQYSREQHEAVRRLVDDLAATQSGPAGTQPEG